MIGDKELNLNTANLISKHKCFSTDLENYVKTFIDCLQQYHENCGIASTHI